MGSEALLRAATNLEARQIIALLAEVSDDSPLHQLLSPPPKEAADAVAEGDTPPTATAHRAGQHSCMP